MIVWRRHGATAKQCSSNHYGVWGLISTQFFHLFAMGRHCDARWATR